MIYMVLANYDKVKLKLCMTCAHVHMLEDWHASEMNPPENLILTARCAKHVKDRSLLAKVWVHGRIQLHMADTMQLLSLTGTCKACA